MTSKMKKWFATKRTKFSFHSRVLDCAKKGNVDLLRQLLQEQQKVPQSKRSIQQALCIAIDANNPRCVRLLLEAGATSNSIKSTRETIPIPFYVIRHRLDEILLCLLENGCRVNQGWMNNETVLHYAVRTMNVDAVRMLMDANADPYVFNEKGDSPLTIAIENNQHDVINCILKQPRVMTMSDHKGRTPLHLAAALGSVETVKLMIDHGFHPGGTDDQGYTPLMEAVLRHRAETVRYLSLKCDLDFIGKRGMTSLLYATQINGEVCARILLSAGASCNVRDAMGNTALILAGQNLSLLSMLLEFGADPDIQNNYGMTPLWYAAFYEYSAAVLLLLRANSNPELKGVTEDEFHTSPLEIALKTGHYSTSKQIIYSGCVNRWLSRFMVNADLMHVFRTSEEGRALKAWINQWLRRVKSLKYLARNSIRKNMGSIKVMSRVAELPLPQALIQYVDLCDLGHIG